MRVAIVTESFLPQVNGVTNSVLRILENLAQNNHQALVIAPEAENTPKEYAGHRVKTIPALPIQNVFPIGMPVGLPSRKLEYVLDGFAPDVMHLASPFALGSFSAKLGRKLGIPTLSVYQTDLAGFARHYGLSIAGSTLQKIVGKIHAQTDRTLAPSTSACKELGEQGVKDVYLWRRGVNSELFNPTKRSAELRNSWDPSGKRTIIGYVGRIANEKRISDLRFIARDPNIQLVITGEGPARAKLEKEIPSAIFTGFQSGEDLARIYASLDLFIHPGPNETFCQSVQEALASGVPCIVPTTGGPADLVTHGTTGYVMNIHRPDELEAAVLHFRLRNDRNEMSRLARESVEQRTWSAINSELLNHYNEVIDQKHNRVDEVVA
jgi:phosphatidylinositol alpha 1,6-mannosyltransferase